MLQATDVRKQWSSVCDSVIHNKPEIIKRTRDKMWLSSLETMSEILSAYRFTANYFVENDGSVTISLNEIDLVENGKDMKEAKENMGNSILEYAKEYYEEYEAYSHAPNRKCHIPYVFKALITGDPSKIGEDLCLGGKN